MVWFGDSIVAKTNGIVYFRTEPVLNYTYVWGDNFNVMTKLAALNNTRIGGIWHNHQWYYRGNSEYYKLIRKYYNV